MSRRVCGDRRSEHQAFLLRHRAHERGDVADQRRQVERCILQFQPAGFDAREVERIVDHAQHHLARRLDRFGVAALLRVERRAQQQLGHAEHAGHRRADLVAHRGEEIGFRRARRLGETALLFGEGERVPAHQPRAVVAQHPPGEQQQDERVAGIGPPRRPRRCGLVEAQRRDLAPHTARIRRAQLQLMMSCGQLRVFAFIAVAGVDPIAVDAAHLPLITISQRIGVGKRRGVHAQIAIVPGERERAGGVVEGRIAGCTTHCHAFHRQPRRHGVVGDSLRQEADHAAERAAEHAAVGAHDERHAAELGADQTVVQAERAHRARARIEPPQAARAADPHRTAGIHVHAADGERRPARFRIDTLDRFEPSVLLAIVFERAGKMQPERAVGSVGKRQHARRRRAGHGGEMLHRRVEPVQARAARCEQRAVAVESDLVDFGVAQPRVLLVEPLDGMREGVDAMHRTAVTADPNRTGIRLREQIHDARGQRVAALLVDRQIAEFSSLQVINAQAARVSDPELAVPVGQHRPQRFVRRRQMRLGMLHAAAGRIEQIDAAARIDHPDLPGGVLRHALHAVRGETRRIAWIVVVQAEIAPLRRQPRNATLERREPEPALVIAHRIERRAAGKTAGHRRVFLIAV